ncbi:hypothetical protein [Streptomyces flaveolus]|uniref:hypothetical protein n=1 Tax=Streptomyces flaveolus TaxID=67297 RepID=UPI0019CBEE85|nr:hypothetical protein [Streptomyces flaveolus]GGQ76956.1 hypothetical protein GCM10010216_43710 [Streptomyces flaveolus]
MQDRYRVVTGPPWSPPSVSAEDLEGLAAALNALQSPAVAALNDLTADMVELAFNSLRPKHRQELLTSLGIRMSAPRRVSSALCRDVLTRLRRQSRQHTCTCGIKGLTVTVMNQVGDFVLAHDGEPVPDPVARWGATLVRATVFAWCNASVTDAHILAWAADQDWFGATADDEAARLAAVAAAARPLMEAYPDFVLGAAEDDGLALAEESEPGAAAVADRPGASAPAPQTAAADTGTSHEETATASDYTGTKAGTAPEETCQQLESALAGARQAAEKVTDAVMDGRPPQDEDLARLAALSTVFNDVDAVFRAAGIEGVPRRLEDITRAAHAHRTARERDLQAREPLRELLDVACRPDSSAAAAAAAEAVRGAARRLLDVPVWEELQHEESAALAALARLIRLGRQADAATEILALQGQIVRVLPTCAMAVLIAPELTLDQPVDGEPYPAGTAEAHGTAEPADAETTAEHETVQSAASTEAIAPQPAAEPEATTAVPVHAPKADAGPAADSDSALPTSADAPVQAPAAPTPSPVDDTPVRAAAPAADDATHEAAVEGALAQLVVERRFGLAHHVARAAGHPEPQVAAIRLAGAAALLTSGGSQSARLTADLLQEYGGYAGQDTEGSELLLLPALLRTALITGDHAAGAQLKGWCRGSRTGWGRRRPPSPTVPSAAPC